MARVENFYPEFKAPGCHKACSGPITCVKSIPLQTKFDLISFEELIGSIHYAD
jgi:hypothetical protein